MKLNQFPTAARNLTRLFPVVVRSTVRALFFCATLLPTILLRAASLPPRTVYWPFTFEQNRGQAPEVVKWLGQSSGYRLLFENDGVTFLLPDKNDTRAIAGRRPVPVERSLRMK
ncbi:MAG: hypothetical protein WA510_30580, partial [Acidobacteriaceae bacterium]